ncbi:hypothetical protein PVAND_012973 [Polypedilum vanderplanki]|uniref:C-type lectin domain-containing protein n=1 Tax=Polypedilum vanderplanki TaxID=319348 RepID=A0A9J6CP78_POLVA|nr:hypothetical protein PVAND_012973 [Polypedilum vanderplanki]
MHVEDAKHLDDAHYYEKYYYVPRNVKTSWEKAKNYCESNGYQLATFETLDELNSILKSRMQYQQKLFTHYTLIGGQTHQLMSKQNWFWIYSGKQIAYKMIWENDKPNGDEGNGYCLSFGPTMNSLKFNDLSCNSSHHYTFICMKVKKFMKLKILFL